jgi:hypothetical protein
MTTLVQTIKTSLKVACHLSISINCHGIWLWTLTQKIVSSNSHWFEWDDQRQYSVLFILAKYFILYYSLFICTLRTYFSSVRFIFNERCSCLHSEQMYHIILLLLIEKLAEHFRSIQHIYHLLDTFDFSMSYDLTIAILLTVSLVVSCLIWVLLSTSSNKMRIKSVVFSFCLSL